MYHQGNGSRSKLFSLFFILVMCCLFLGASALHPSARAGAAGVTLGWDASAGVSGYKIYRGTASGSYTTSVDVGNTTSYTLSDLASGTTYYFAVTAYDSSKEESGYSNEVSYAGGSSCTYSISPSSASFTSSGGTGTITVTAASGCTWSASTGVSWATISSGTSGTGNGTVTYSVAANTGSARTAAFTVAGQTFSISQAAATSTTTYTLTLATAGTGSGTITSNPSGTVFASGTAVTITAAPDSGSTFTGWGGDCAFAGTSTTCSGKMTRNISVTANFTRSVTTTYHTISASAGTGGSISPSGSVSVSSGSSKSFTITPSSGYTISDVTVDGQSVGAVSSYTFSNVTANHTIAATFTQSGTSTTTYTLTATTAGTGSGTITVNPSGTVFASGTAVTLTAAPDSNSVFAGWGGDCAFAGTSTTCNGKMTRNINVTATFNARTTTSSYTISAYAGYGGTISPSGSVSVSSGSGKSFTIAPKTGFSIRYVLVDGVNVGAVSSYTFSNVTANHTIRAYFKYGYY
ncbi:MAG: Fibronectin type III domain protein [Syntrophorhabdus sp. PtaB.Bin047]|nr:MAG: Fibronectin type III domain protein [Syntrophorhabdus sp. PtaB.Bin047]